MITLGILPSDVLFRLGDKHHGFQPRLQIDVFGEFPLAFFVRAICQGLEYLGCEVEGTPDFRVAIAGHQHTIPEKKQRIQFSLDLPVLFALSKGLQKGREKRTIGSKVFHGRSGSDL